MSGESGAIGKPRVLLAASHLTDLTYLTHLTDVTGVTAVTNLTHLTPLTLLPIQLLILDATINGVVQNREPQLAVGLCVAPNAVVRTIK
jgi:hypothetical protein